MRCAKSYKFWHIWTVLFHLWNGTERCVKKKIYFIHSSLFFITFLSLSLLIFFFFLPPPAPCSCHPLFPFSSFFSSIFTVALGSFSCLFFPVTISLSLSFPIMKKKVIPIWSRARRFEALFAQGQSPIFARRRPQLSSPMVGWVWSLIDLLGWGFVEDFEFFFFFWLRFLDLEFVERFGDCGCSLWRWLLVLGWWWLPLAVHLYICWVLGKCIILIFRIKE